MSGGTQTDGREPRHERLYYETAGLSYEYAYEHMAERIRKPFCPPSLDVFQRELKVVNAQSIQVITPQSLAETYVLRAKAKGHARA